MDTAGGKIKEWKHEKKTVKPETVKPETAVQELQGSYTVEAAVVVSLVFFVLAALILCTFYVHDRAVFQSAACEASSAGNNFITAKERKEAMSEVKQRMTQSRFLGSKNIKGNTATGKKEASSSWSAVYPFPGFVMKFISGGRLEIRKSWSSKILNPADTIRMIRGVGELIGAEE